MGVMPVDFAKHIADASEQLGKGTKSEILRAIRLAFDTNGKPQLIINLETSKGEVLQIAKCYHLALLEVAIV